MAGDRDQRQGPVRKKAEELKAGTSSSKEAVRDRVHRCMWTQGGWKERAEVVEASGGKLVRGSRLPPAQILPGQRRSGERLL
jgi:hypothetical protein